MPAITLSAPAPPARTPWRLAARTRLRRALVVDFSCLDRLDLGDLADLDVVVAESFSRGGHRPCARA